MAKRKDKLIQVVVVNRVHWGDLPISTILKEINEAKKEAKKLGVDPETLEYYEGNSPFNDDGNYKIYQIVGYRKETDKEQEKRLRKEQQVKKEFQERRRKQYEELRKEFEGK